MFLESCRNAEHVSAPSNLHLNKLPAWLARSENPDLTLHLRYDLAWDALVAARPVDFNP